MTNSTIHRLLSDESGTVSVELALLTSVSSVGLVAAADINSDLLVLWFRDAFESLEAMIGTVLVR